MPRTKQVRKKSSVAKRHKQNETFASHESLVSSSTSPYQVQTLLSQEYESLEDFMREFDTYYNDQIQTIQQGYDRACNEVKKMFRNILQDLPDSIKYVNINGDIEKDFVVEDQNRDPNSIDSSSVKEQRSRKPAETSVFKMPKTPVRAKSRSSSRKRSSSVPRAPVPQANSFKTPLMSSKKLPAGATITPKIYSDSPITIMRRPFHGEVAISLSGSPLMVGATSREDIPTVNVPLHDGRIFSIMPEIGAPPIDLPLFDDATKQYLKTLREHLEILAPNTP